MSHNKYNRPFRFSDAISVILLPIIFGLFGILGVEAAQPLSSILGVSCVLIFIAAVIFTLYARKKEILLTRQLEDQLLLLSFTIMLVHINTATLYLLIHHLFWFFVLLILWIASTSVLYVVYRRYTDQITEERYQRLKKGCNRFFLWSGIVSFTAFLAATFGYHRFSAYREDVVPPAVFFFGQYTGHMIIMLSFSLIITILFTFVKFAVFERIMRRKNDPSLADRKFFF